MRELEVVRMELGESFCPSPLESSVLCIHVGQGHAGARPVYSWILHSIHSDRESREGIRRLAVYRSTDQSDYCTWENQ